MHPIFLSGKNLATVAGLWLVLAALISTFLQAHIQNHIKIPFSTAQATTLFLPWLFIFLFFCLSNFYICIRIPINSYNFMHVLAVQIVAAITTIAIWFILGYLWAVFLHKMGEPNWQPLLTDLRNSILTISAILYLLWVLIHYMYLLAEQQEILKRDELQKKLLISQIELQSIKATTHPHFLYNALNTVANISLTTPDKVHNLCLQISEFLRYSVGYSKKQNITVNDELEHIQNYLGIERERFGERLDIIFNIDEKTRSKKIMPLILFPLIENSIKHGIDSLIEGGTITISIKQEGEGLSIIISNPFDPLGIKPSSTNLGLSALKKRINSTYGPESSIKVDRNNNEFRVALFLAGYF